MCSLSAYYIGCTIHEASKLLPALTGNNRVRVTAACVAAILCGGCASMFGPQVDDLGLYSYEDQTQPAAGAAYVGEGALFSATYWPQSGPFGNFYGGYDPLICPPSVATPSVPVIPAAPTPIPTVGEDGDIGPMRPIRRTSGAGRSVVSSSPSAFTGSSVSGSGSSSPTPRSSASRSPRPSSSSAAQTVTR